ncbi:MAG: hypothetical protein IPG71_03960 [bacterium]|nr:hypothetical protein [bacterium]
MRTLQLHLTDRARRAQMMNHATPGIMLIVLGVSAILSGHTEHLWIDIIGIIAGVALIVSLKREWKHGAHGHGKVGWFDIIAGIVIVIEGYHKLHPGKWFQPGSLLMLVGVMTIVIGIFHHRITALRRLTCTNDGFKLRSRLISSFSGKWRDIHNFSLDGTSLVIERRDKSVSRHSLRRIENRLDVLKTLEEELERCRSASNVTGRA